jgi:hypothetical protein
MRNVIDHYDEAGVGEYVDVHGWVFTPSSFECLILELHCLGLIGARSSTRRRAVSHATTVWSPVPLCSIRSGIFGHILMWRPPGMDAAEHYLRFGANEGRDPGPKEHARPWASLG